MLESCHEEAWKGQKFPDTRRAATFQRLGAAQLEAYRKKGGVDSPPEFLEHAFSAAVDGRTLRGIIHRIDRTETGGRTGDYKSGRPLTRPRCDTQRGLAALVGATA